MNRSNIFRFVLAAVAILSVQLNFASGRASELLTKLSAAFRAMPTYGVNFEVKSDDYATSGHYHVKAESYYMLFGQAEVYCNGKERYEIDRSRAEVTITNVDPTSRNIINNPIRAFDFIGSQYTPELIAEGQGSAHLRLISTDPNDELASVITLLINIQTMLPQSLSYQLDGQKIDIKISSIEPLKSPIKSFSKSQYDGYEFIDFR